MICIRKTKGSNDKKLKDYRMRYIDDKDDERLYHNLLFTKVGLREVI